MFCHHPTVPSPWKDTPQLFPCHEKGSADKPAWFGGKRRGLQPPPRPLSFRGCLLRYRIIPACWHYPCLIRFAGVHYQGMGWQRAHSLASLVMLGEQYLWKQRISYSRPGCYVNWKLAACQPKKITCYFNYPQELGVTPRPALDVDLVWPCKLPVAYAIAEICGPW